MKKLTLVLLLLFVTKISAQINHSDIQTLTLEFSHSLRIPYNFVSVKIVKFKDTIKLKVSSKASSKNTQWSYSNFDKNYVITTKEFDEITMGVAKLDPDKISQNFKHMLIDGYTCKIEFGNYANSITYKLGGPNQKHTNDTTHRYFEICKMILKAAKLDPKEIMS